MRTSTILTAAAVVAVLTPGRVDAQGAGQCTAGEAMVTKLPIGGLNCSNCTLSRSGDPRGDRWEFASEPVVETSDDPDGRIRPGDVIVSIDGNLITTRRGGERFARPVPGRAADVRLRRDGREINVAIQPVTECRNISDTQAVTATDTRQRASSIDRVEVSRSRGVSVFPSATQPVLPQLMPTGWLGLSFQCTNCSVRVEGDSIRSWSFAEPPTILAVEGGGPAAEAGIRTGDRIVSVDGLRVTTTEGGERFGMVAPGRTVTLGIDRGGRTSEARLVPGDRLNPGAGRSIGVGRSAVSSGAQTISARVVRYSGQLGDTMIEVTGEPVTVVQQKDEIVIRSSSLTVRLRRSGAGR